MMHNYEKYDLAIIIVCTMYSLYPAIWNFVYR